MSNSTLLLRRLRRRPITFNVRVRWNVVIITPPPTPTLPPISPFLPKVQAFSELMKVVSGNVEAAAKSLITSPQCSAIGLGAGVSLVHTFILKKTGAAEDKD